MVAQEAERCALTLRQVTVPATAVAERHRRGVIPGHIHVPAVDDIGGFLETQLDLPAVNGPRTVVGDRYIQLVTITATTGLDHCTTVRSKCLAGQQHAEQQHSEFKE